MSDTSDFTQQAADFRERYNAVKNEVGKVIVGHEEIVHGVLTGFDIVQSPFAGLQPNPVYS